MAIVIAVPQDYTGLSVDSSQSKISQVQKSQALGKSKQLSLAQSPNWKKNVPIILDL